MYENKTQIIKALQDTASPLGIYSILKDYETILEKEAQEKNRTIPILSEIASGYLNPRIFWSKDCGNSTVRPENLKALDGTVAWELSFMKGEPVMGNDGIIHEPKALYSNSYKTKSEIDVLLNEIRKEVVRARTLHPGNNLQTMAFSEEAGELVKAVMDESVENVRTEAIQAAAMAIRVVIDGDSTMDNHRERKGLGKLGC